MRTVTAAVANREFSKLLRAAQDGETVTITSRGRPVARISPATSDTAEREAGHAALLEFLDAQPIRPPSGHWTRADLYERSPKE